MTVLVLDSTWRPIGTISVKKAVKNCLLGKATVILAYEDRLYHAGNATIPIPRVICVKAYIPVTKQVTKNVSKKLLYARDNYTCQYCGTPRDKLRPGIALTKDHCKPISAFEGATRAERYRKANTWENVTTACSECNHKKGDKLPYEVHMYPKTTPKRPTGFIITLVEKVDNEQYKFLEPFL